MSLIPQCARVASPSLEEVELPFVIISLPACIVRVSGAAAGKLVV
jgi:hypothetical protein